MKAYIKDNYLIILSIFIPFIVILLFILATVTPTLLVPDPQWDFIFTANDSFLSSPGSYLDNGINFSTEKGHLQVSFVCTKWCRDNPQAYLSTIYYYNAKLKQAKPISIHANLQLLAKSLQTVTNITPPELSTISLDQTPTSPDGYRFISTQNSWDQFGFFSRQIPQPILEKKGRRIILLQNHSGFSKYKFIGWVRKQ